MPSLRIEKAECPWLRPWTDDFRGELTAAREPWVQAVRSTDFDRAEACRALTDAYRMAGRLEPRGILFFSQASTAALYRAFRLRSGGRTVEDFRAVADAATGSETAGQELEDAVAASLALGLPEDTVTVGRHLHRDGLGPGSMDLHDELFKPLLEKLRGDGASGQMLMTGDGLKIDRNWSGHHALQRLEERTVGQAPGLRIRVEMSGVMTMQDIANNAAYMSFVTAKTGHVNTMEPLGRLIRAGVWLTWTGKESAIAVRKPLMFRTDERDRIHAADGPAIRYADGGEAFVWHGVRIPRDVFERKGRLTARDVLGERNAEVRRVMLEWTGLERLLVEGGGKTVHQDMDARGNPRRLMRVEWEGDEPLTAVVLVCPSTNKRYVLRVPPRLETCGQAVAWTFDQPAKEYRPAVET